MAAFSQKTWACRCEWGAAAVAALAPADVTIVVDVFSFTTCVDVAVSRGAAILPYAWDDAAATEFARASVAEAAGLLGSSFNVLRPARGGLTVRCDWRWRLVRGRSNSPMASRQPFSGSGRGRGALQVASTGARATLDQCGSWRELDERGHDKDKFIAGQLDVSSCVARFGGIAFVSHEPRRLNQRPQNGE